MKKMFRRRLSLILSIGMLASLFIAFSLQVRMIRAETDSNSSWLFWQVQQILTENQIEADQAKEDYRALCLSRAKAAAYIIQNSGTDLSDSRELARIADLLQVDELHIFDTTGTIVAGSEPKYFGYNFNSGEQMQFFLPLMDDHSLELCQDVTPNTAEGKLMQYAAVWQENDEGLVQIGVTPDRVLEAMAKNELSYIFSLLTDSAQATLCAAAPQTYQILGATKDGFQEHTLMELGFDQAQLDRISVQLAQSPLRPSGEQSTPVQHLRIRVDGVRYYCIFTMVNGLLIGHFYQETLLFAPAFYNTMIFAGLLLGIFLLMQLWISKFLGATILRGLSVINGKLKNIADGQLDETVNVDTTPEFAQLSWYINHMVKSILSTTAKLSFVLSAVQLPIAVYEYSRRMNRVYFTSKLPEILGLNTQEADRLLHDRRLFEEKLDAVKSQPVGGNVFRTTGGRYVKMEAYTGEASFFGILVDVTADVTEKQRLERERNVDLLTNLYNRRGFYEQLDGLFENPELLGYGALVMIDTDNLKDINDRLGHEAGDEYLRSMARILESDTGASQVAARLSGDEFALFLFGCRTEEALSQCLARLEAQQNPAPGPAGAPAVRFSMGTALCPADSSCYHTLLKLADQRMYENKRLRKANPKT